MDAGFRYTTLNTTTAVDLGPVQMHASLFTNRRTPEVSSGLAERVKDGALSMAKVREFLVRHRDDLDGARTNWIEFERVAVAVKR